MLQEGFETLRNEYLQMWERTPSDGEKTRERLYFALKTLGFVKTHLQRVMSDGVLAEAELEALAAADTRAA